MPKRIRSFTPSLKFTKNLKNDACKTPESPFCLPSFSGWTAASLIPPFVTGTYSLKTLHGCAVRVGHCRRPLLFQEFWSHGKWKVGFGRCLPWITTFWRLPKLERWQWFFRMGPANKRHDEFPKKWMICEAICWDTPFSLGHKWLWMKGTSQQCGTGEQMKKRAPTTWVRAAGFRYLLKCVELHEARLPSRSFVSRVLASFQENELDICFAVTTFWGATKKNAVFFSLGIHNKYIYNYVYIYIYIYTYIHIYIYDSVYEGNNLMVGNDPWVLRFSFYGLVLGISDFWKFARRRLVWCMAQRSTDGNSDDLAWLSGPKEKGSLSPQKMGSEWLVDLRLTNDTYTFCTEKKPYSYLWVFFLTNPMLWDGWIFHEPGSALPEDQSLVWSPSQKTAGGWMMQPWEAIRVPYFLDNKALMIWFFWFDHCTT